MAAHHTKDKGDLGVAKAHADLVGKGFVVLFPATEHAPFDLVAYRDHRFRRVQVKYRSSARGSVEVKFSSSWSDRHGKHATATDKSSIDLLCLYCPETDCCYYLDPSQFRTSVTLRFAPSRNGQHVGVLEAERFREVPG